MPQKIRDLLTRDLNERIEEIIKVEQADEDIVYRELTEYVATERIRIHYQKILQAMADAPAQPQEGVGIWISGFFGSGKSSFAKNLGYVLANREVRGQRAADLFKRAVNDKLVSALVDTINTRIPTDVIMFDVSVNSLVRSTNQTIAEIMYTVLLNHLGYAEDFDIAELEIQLEREGQLQRFIEIANSRRITNDREPQRWDQARSSAFRMNIASATLHAMEPATFPQADSWARSLAGKNADITVERFVERAFDLMERRRPGKAFAFIIDEVGQYVARSAAKIEDLRAVVERFGQVSRNRVAQHKAIAPTWIAVTSQEKLEEVVAAIDSKRVELAKVQDRFTYRVDLAPADIREVATKRVLGKREEVKPELAALYSQTQGQLNAACRLEHSQRASEVSAEEFIQFYPYLPHYIDLSIDIVSGIRVSQPGAPQHLGGSNRTIIKQAQEMLVSPRTAMADRPVGTLVTLDLVYELVEGNFSSEKQKDISDITERARRDPHAGEWAPRVSKVIALLELVRNLPASEPNIAALLVGQLGQSAPINEVMEALKWLEETQFVRRTSEGYKLQTAQEKNWEKERSQFDPRPRDRNEIKREALTAIFDDAKFHTYKYHGRTFRVGVTADDARLKDGAVPLTLLVAESVEPNDPEGQRRLTERAQSDSRADAHKNDIYWVFPLTSEIHSLITQLYASRQMIAKYNQLSSQGQLMRDFAPLLESEKREEARLKDRLRDKTMTALASGRGFFRGVSKDATDLGRTAVEMLHGLFEYAVPDIYPKLDLGVQDLRGNEAEEVLKAANLNALPPVFYGDKLNLVTQEGGRFVANLNAPIAKEILDYLSGEQSYGNKVTGKDLEAKFTGIGYGWDPDVIKLTLALLLRAGAIEVTHQGRTYRNAQDPQSRAPLTNNIAFRAAAFASRKAIDLKALASATRSYEALTGEDVDVEESAIAQALKKLADEETRLLQPVIAKIQANQLPVPPALNSYEESLNQIHLAASDDCVRFLANEGNTFRELREQMGRIRKAVSDEHLALLRWARRVMHEEWPALEALGLGADHLESATALRELLESGEFYECLPQIEKLASELDGGYMAAYRALHAERHTLYTQAQDTVKNRPEWSALTTDAQTTLLAPLAGRACLEEPDLTRDSSVCHRCHATLAQIDTDRAAAPTFTSNVVANLQAFVAQPAPDAGGPPVLVRRVRAAEFFAGPLDTEQAVDEAIKALRDQLYKWLAEGSKVVVE